MSLVFSLLILCLAFVPALACIYLGLLTLLSGKLDRPLPASRTLRFDIIVPAHQEEAVIARTVASLKKLDWPTTHYRIIVVADNCTDATAERARAAGAEVLIRHHDTQRGKGYALKFAFAHSQAQGLADAVVLIDADAVVTPNLLESFAARIEQGAQAMQARYGVLNLTASWRIRLTTIAYGAFHDVRSRARERLGLSCGLRGNGMCLTAQLLQRQPWNVFSLTEDIEYGLQLGMNGIRVHYVDEASVDAELPEKTDHASTQRQRWEGGRLTLTRQYAWKLLHQGITQPSKICLELALDLLTPPLAQIAFLIVATLVFSSIASLFWPLQWGIWLSLAMIAVLVAYVLRGWRLSGLGLSALRDFLHVPAFIAWKLYAKIKHRHNRSWIKTQRNDDTPEDQNKG
ncbi:glycosyltransferase family 2 protein [Kerstersia sp.]|uniref:glycosyltransferase family 2 protein n=1 Tax=Kerstersia sp. TaxID=1930783 RepID=UPI003F8EB205